MVGSAGVEALAGYEAGTRLEFILVSLSHGNPRADRNNDRNKRWRGPVIASLAGRLGDRSDDR
jgi:hypothetical protein